MDNEYLRAVGILVLAGIIPFLAHLLHGGSLSEWKRPFLLALNIVGFLAACGALAYLISQSIFIAAGVVMALLWTGIAVAGHKLVFGESDWRKDLERRRAARRGKSQPAGDQDPAERH
ncbi:MAG TPA: hypothetical protein ENJ97_01960 [Planctomycetes bacterium]|nr:hypothetical protein [Planctomycetota bacterium]